LYGETTNIMLEFARDDSIHVNFMILQQLYLTVL